MEAEMIVLGCFKIEFMIGQIEQPSQIPNPNKKKGPQCGPFKYHIFYQLLRTTNGFNCSSEAGIGHT
jgi:hypothetical protein